MVSTDMAALTPPPRLAGEKIQPTHLPLEFPPGKKWVHRVDTSHRGWWKGKCIDSVPQWQKYEKTIAKLGEII